MENEIKFVGTGIKQVFISVIAQQSLAKVNYKPIGTAKEQITVPKDYICSYPILPVIRSIREQDSESEMRIILVKAENDNTDSAEQVFREQLAELDESLDNDELISVVELSSDQRLSTGVSMFLGLLSNIEENTEIYADITYGTKAMTVIMNYLLSSIEYLRKGTEVCGIYYGNLERGKDNKPKMDKAYLYDYTGVLELNKLIETAKKINIPDPEKFILGLIAEEVD
ncbi:hypothetical protein [Enterococcus sp. AZ109]|uniref:hypothetical protein n=1 Tax=Enterococcus sp. AZ109 TaxID=2774634 RepID=UPI003F248E9D